MSNIFYESLGRLTWWHAKRLAVQRLRDNSLRVGATAALIVGIVVAGAVIARSNAIAE